MAGRSPDRLWDLHNYGRVDFETVDLSGSGKRDFVDDAARPSLLSQRFGIKLFCLKTFETMESVKLFFDCV